MRYPIVIHKDPNSDYGVTVPDVPGCFSAGGTLDEAIDMAREAIEAHIELLFEEGEPVPKGSTVEDHKDDPDYSGGAWAYVDVDMVELLGKTERFNVTLPALLVKQVDGYLASNATSYKSRSDFFAKLAAERLDIVSSGARNGSLAVKRSTKALNPGVKKRPAVKKSAAKKRA